MGVSPLVQVSLRIWAGTWGAALGMKENRGVAGGNLPHQGLGESCGQGPGKLGG